MESVASSVLHEIGPSQQMALVAFRQPLTATQLASILERRAKSVMDLLRRMVSSKRVRCLTPELVCSRVYGLTGHGRRCRRKLLAALGLPRDEEVGPFEDWSVYGRVCHRHRGVVVRELSGPMRPADLRRKARRRLGQLTMSANNAREVVKRLVLLGVLRRTRIGRAAHWSYELTEKGSMCRGLLLNIERLRIGMRAIEQKMKGGASWADA